MDAERRLKGKDAEGSFQAGSLKACQEILRRRKREDAAVFTDIAAIGILESRASRIIPVTG